MRALHEKRHRDNEFFEKRVLILPADNWRRLSYNGIYIENYLRITTYLYLRCLRFVVPQSIFGGLSSAYSASEK